MINMDEYSPLKEISIANCFSVTKTSMGITRNLMEHLGRPLYISFMKAKDGKSIVISTAKEDGRKIRYSAYGSAVFNDTAVRHEIMKRIDRSELPIRFEVECRGTVLVVNLEKWCNGISNTHLRNRK